MKILIIALSIIAMLGVIFPSLPILAQPILVPHENPDTATSLLDEAGLLLSYSQIINIATKSQYQSAQDILDEFEHVNIPDEIRYIIIQYGYLLQQLFTTLDKLESLLDKASGLLANNQISEVENMLDLAHADIQDADTLLEDIKVATDVISDKLGVFAISATGPLTQAYTRLEESMERLSDLISELNRLNQSLSEQYVEKTRLIPTELSLNINPASAYVGDSITASGRLSSEGNPLAGKNLSLTLNNDKVATAITGFDGSYVTSITLPYQYTENVTFTAVYKPAGNDASIYLASESPKVTVNTMFYQTMLEVSSPEKVYRGLPFTVSGTVTDSHDNIRRNIKVLLNDASLVEDTVSGQFNFEITLPEKTPLGTGNLTVAVSPRGRYADTSEARSVTISVVPVHVDTRTPSVTLLPGDIQISGTVYSGLGPLVDTPVSLHLNKFSTTVRTSDNGNFAASLETKLDLFLIGSQEILINVEPLEPWAPTTNVKQQIFIINPLNTSLMLAILVALWLVIRRRSRIRTYTEKEIPPVEVVEVPPTPPLPAPIPKLTGIKGQVLSAYRSVIAAVEKINGVIMSPDVTLREFLKIAQLRSPTANALFAELTTIAETTLYSAYSPQQDTAARAEELAANIKEELRSGPT